MFEAFDLREITRRFPSRGYDDIIVGRTSRVCVTKCQRSQSSQMGVEKQK